VQLEPLEEGLAYAVALCERAVVVGVVQHGARLGAADGAEHEVAAIDVGVYERVFLGETRGRAVEEIEEGGSGVGGDYLLAGDPAAAHALHCQPAGVAVNGLDDRLVVLGGVSEVAVARGLLRVVDEGDLAVQPGHVAGVPHARPVVVYPHEAAVLIGEHSGAVHVDFPEVVADELSFCSAAGNLAEVIGADARHIDFGSDVARAVFVTRIRLVIEVVVAVEVHEVQVMGIYGWSGLARLESIPRAEIHAGDRRVVADENRSFQPVVLPAGAQLIAEVGRAAGVLAHRDAITFGGEVADPGVNGGLRLRIQRRHDVDIERALVAVGGGRG